MLVVLGWSFAESLGRGLACLRLHIEIQVQLAVFNLSLSHQMPSSNEDFEWLFPKHLKIIFN